MNTRLELLGLLVLAMLVGAGAADAAVNLRFTPADTTVAPGAPGRLAINIDDPDANVRTIDVYVTYDTTVVRSVSGQPGQAFLDSGYFLFKGFENDVPGQWHGYCVILGSTDWLTGPGELYTWEFEGLAHGVSPVIAIEAYVAAGDGTYYEDVQLDATAITVFDPLSAVDDVPSRGPALRAWPNPFNPRTAIAINLPEPGPVTVDVYDVAGNRVRSLHDGPLPAGSFMVSWDGRDATGRSQPSGRYLVRMVSSDGIHSLKLLLVK